MFRYGMRYYPDEIAGLVLGYRSGMWNYATTLLKVRVVNSSFYFVEPHLPDVLVKARKFYPLGFFHTHPDGLSLASEEDLEYTAMLEGKFRRRIFMFIMSVPAGKLSCYLDGEQVRYQVWK
jgi:proteasome lid subunit RPN8/RPN11